MADTSALVQQLLRASERVLRRGRRAKESGARIKDGRLAIRETRTLRILEAAPARAGDGPVVKVVLIDEGLGNRRSMNYYGPEAIASAVKMFEGKPSFMDHPSESEESDLPERSVRKKYGYFKNLKLDKILSPESGGVVSACVGELHFDLSEAGREAYAKAQTALHYQKEFPDSPMQYIGWSVLGDGKAERKKIKVGGEQIDVNYVTEFAEADSCDMVTRAGRGGRILVAVSESDEKPTREDDMKKLKAVLASIQESAKKAEGEERKRLEEAAKNLDAQIKVLESEDESEDEAEESEDGYGFMKQSEGESEGKFKARLAKIGKMIAKKLANAESEDESEDEDEAGAIDSDGDSDSDRDSDSAAPRKKQSESADMREAKALAVKAYMAEAGLPEGAFSKEKVARLLRMPFREAKAVIDDAANLAEAVISSIDMPVASLRSSTREGAGGNKTRRFAESLKEVR